MEANRMGMELIERIRERAYQLWEAEGCEHGRDMEYWLRAEAQVADEQAAEQAQAQFSQTQPPQAQPPSRTTPLPVPGTAAVRPETVAKPKGHRGRAMAVDGVKAEMGATATSASRKERSRKV